MCQFFCLCLCLFLFVFVSVCVCARVCVCVRLCEELFQFGLPGTCFAHLGRIQEPHEDFAAFMIIASPFALLSFSPPFDLRMHPRRQLDIW